MKCYYDVHVFYSRKNGFSIPVKIETDEILTDIDIIKICVDNGSLNSDDSDQVDYVAEIEEDEYNQMKGI